MQTCHIVSNCTKPAPKTFELREGEGSKSRENSHLNRDPECLNSIQSNSKSWGLGWAMINGVEWLKDERVFVVEEEDVC